ncbi:hypothetical protein Cob_v011849 [Colletotrichum orbiculare MAFF 240422]|uniref:Uncharacterized protein n=1 Tax=Colletotrichum orbiculare (strain 104-T / ATCC 96160 / CBS 514.97 / LARS 414 / MAFF 240422) TaxID=1213857 RepID=A0A484FBB1_COLOR|nr:hypothetical protein Cob_v011849 [Colletotrichum orbiculare MAFF 240422]
MRYLSFILLLVISGLSRAADPPKGLPKGDRLRQKIVCEPGGTFGLKCCAGLTCFQGLCRLAQDAGCIAERRYCGINAPDRPCCPPYKCILKRNSAGNGVFQCR